jgi:NitT/TauT family transport system permease protein
MRVVLSAPAWKELGARYGLPIGLGVAVLLVWESLVRAYDVPKFVLPAPSLVFQTLVADAGYLFKAWQYTALISFGAFVAALLSGFLFGVLITQNRTLERMFWPYAVILHATPNFALAPLILIWVGFDNSWLALLLIAWLVAFFPILSNTVIGLKSADHGLRNIFGLYQASRWKRFRYLQLPASLPYVMAGVRISASLAVIGAIVAEFLASSGTASGLAWAIMDSGTQLNIPRMFAAVMVLSAFGLVIFYISTYVQHKLLAHWHESETHQEN